MNFDISDEQMDQPISMEEIKSAVFAQNNNKSPGIDNLPSEVFKGTFDIISPFLFQLYNRMYTHAEYPKSWGEGVVTPIFK